MVAISLTQNKIALIDDEDFWLISQYKWYPKRHRNTYYASANGPRINGKRQTIFMHQLLLPSSKEQQVDHKNGNGLDNRRGNLRFATHAENMRNRVGNKTSFSKYKGVDWKKSNQKWRARIRVNNKELHLGCFFDEIEAAKAYDAAATKHYGEFAKLNFGENYGN
jgi:hypothetical protein